jgi:NAD(P)H dehydrogenase (quinone)
MQPINVVIAFYSRYCETEKLALAVGLGVLEARATPRFRRIPDLAPASLIEQDERWNKNLERMKSEYVAPRPGDPQLADVLVLATPGDETREVERYLETLAADGSLAGKIAAPVSARNREQALPPIFASLARTGMIVVPPPISGDPGDAVRRHGSSLVKMARALKTG